MDSREIIKLLDPPKLFGLFKIWQKGGVIRFVDDPTANIMFVKLKEEYIADQEWHNEWCRKWTAARS